MSISRQRVANYVEGAVAKHLSAVDAEPSRSHQHEIGSNKWKALLGDPGSETLRFRTRFLFLSETAEIMPAADDEVSWYDSRRNNPNRGPELRLYYPDNPVTEAMSEGDFLVVAKRTDGTLLIAVAERDSSAEQRLRWLFGIGEQSIQQQLPVATESDAEVGLVERTVFEELGIEIDEGDNATLLDLLLRRFGAAFPTTKLFSSFARQVAEDAIEMIESPDDLLLTWLETEEILFRILEDHIVASRIGQGFESVDDFVTYSLSVHNRRKSRAGFALENHLEEVLKIQRLSYSRGKLTERRSRPDFVFPSIEHYHSDSFLANRLTMLGCKSSCKDRWRQVLAEAERIARKHLLTIEPGVSDGQLEEMASHNLQLVVPAPIHISYTDQARDNLLSLGAFLSEVRARELRD